jgi:hypothetical protein
MSSLVQQLENQKINTKIQNEIKKNADSKIIIQSQTTEVSNMTQSINKLERNLAVEKASLLSATFDNYCGDLTMKINDLYRDLTIEGGSGLVGSGGFGLAKSAGSGSSWSRSGLATGESVTLNEDTALESIIDSLKEYISLCLPEILMVKNVELLTKEEVIIKKEVAINNKGMMIKNEIKHEVKNDYSRIIPSSTKPNSTLISPKVRLLCYICIFYSLYVYFFY